MKLLIMAGKTEALLWESQMKTHLCSIAVLHVYIVAGYCTGDIAIRIHRQIFEVHLGLLTNPVSEFNTMALPANGI